MAKSDFLETNMLNHVLRNTSYASPGAVYLALYTVAEDDTGTAGTEVTGGSYARQLITFGAPVGNQVSNDADILFAVATADWGTVVHFGIFDAASAGNLLYHAPLTASRTILTGDQLRFPTGQLVVGES
jgi:hypothetical protein